MCTILYPNVKDCSDWCCVSRSGYVFFIVLFFCLGFFLVLAAYYLHRLHQNNVEAGAVVESGEMREHKAPPTEEEMAAARRKKRVVQVDPELLKNLKT